MTNSPESTQSNLGKFQRLLRDLFQFDCAALDFGIYRIMNHKRNVIERFISEQLPEWVDAALEQNSRAQQKRSQEILAQMAQEVRSNLGENAIDEDGILDTSHASLPVGQRYEEAQRLAEESSHSHAEVEARIYNHLYRFFSRYFEDGDFVSKRRYGRNERYAIPYSGEEVHLHWANSDQYYVKSDEYFRNFDWKAANEVKVRFRLRNADVEQDNVKGKTRFFIALAAETEWDAGKGVVTIPFEYRPLSDREKEAFGKGNKRDAIVRATVAAVVEKLQGNERALAALLSERAGVGNEDCPLECHLRNYVQRNSSDFFVHKDLDGFLNRELDFFLKNEVLSLNDLVSAGENLSAGWFEDVRLTKAIGSSIIEFLAQIESFQKMLWEKRKFVTDVGYCVRVGIVDERFYNEITTNDAQWEEWHELYGLDISDRTHSFLHVNPTLVLDTQHFGTDFTDGLLATFSDLDGMTDGLLVHSENWQALRLLNEKFRDGVKCIYIDPPYNTAASSIVYKNGYKDSTWLTMMMNSLFSARELLQTDGILCCAIDDEEAWRLRAILQATFEKELGIVPIRSNPAGRKSSGQFSPSHEYAFFYGMGQSVPGILQKTESELKRYPFSDERGLYAWNNLIRHGSNDKREDAPSSVTYRVCRIR